MSEPSATFSHKLSEDGLVLETSYDLGNGKKGTIINRWASEEVAARNYELALERTEMVILQGVPGNFSEQSVKRLSIFGADFAVTDVALKSPPRSVYVALFGLSIDIELYDGHIQPMTMSIERLPGALLGIGGKSKSWRVARTKDVRK